VGYVVPRSLHGGRWLVTNSAGHGVSFSLSLTAPVPDLRYDGVDVRLVSVTTLEGQITTRLRIYNGQTTPLTFTPDDIWLALGCAPDPPGPRNPAEGMQSFDLLPEQAVDLTLVWYWADEPYGALDVGGYRWVVQVVHQR
jgi:hypothetical protein